MILMELMYRKAPAGATCKAPVSKGNINTKSLVIPYSLTLFYLQYLSIIIE